MSSSFRYFRKHTKTFMAIAAVLCMFIFVIGGSLGNGGPAGDEAQSAREPVATWDGGSINQGELASLIQRRRMTDAFLQRLFVQGGGQTIYDTTVPLFFAQTLNRNDSELAQEVVLTEVFADMARQAGLTVSDDLINHYLEEVGSKNVDGAGVAGILSNMGQGNARANEAVVFETLRKILLGYFYRSAYSDASQTVLPHERWEDWRRVNERIAVQAAVLPVASFLPQVPEPTDAQLMALYEEFKNQAPGQMFTVGNRQLPSPNPGFAEPRRVRLQYVLGSLQARTDYWLDKVTEEEIAKFYEHNKREFMKMSLPGVDDAAEGTESPETDAAAPDADAATTPPAAEPSTTAPSEPAATEPAAAEPAAEPAESPAAPAEAAPAEPPATEEAPAPAEAEGESTSSTRSKSPFRLASFQDAPAEGESETSEPAADAPAEEAPAEAPPVESAPASDAPPAEDAPAEEPAAPDAPPSAGGEPSAEEADESIEYEPLEKVRDEIRRTIAAEKAADELDGIMARASAQLRSEFNRFTVQKANAAAHEQAIPKPPAKLTDLKWLADEHGLTAERTELLTDRELFELPLGKALDESTGARVVTQAVFTTLKQYEPMLAKTRDGDFYLVMKIEDVPLRVPPFDEVKAKVLAAWKHREAAKLAEKKAQELAAEAEKSSTDFGEFFTSKGYEVVKETSLFSWLEYPAGAMGSGNPPGLGDIPELSGVGPDMLRAAFDLDGNKTVGLLNFDQSTAYVLRLARRQYSEEELRGLFLDDANSWPGRRDMLMAHISTFNSAMFKDLRDRANLQFDENWEKQQAERAQHGN